MRDQEQWASPETFSDSPKADAIFALRKKEPCLLRNYESIVLTSRPYESGCLDYEIKWGEDKNIETFNLLHSDIKMPHFMKMIPACLNMTWPLASPGQIDTLRIQFKYRTIKGEMNKPDSSWCKKEY